MFKTFQCTSTLSRIFLMTCLLVLVQLANAQRPEPPPIEDRRYEDNFTFKPTTAGWTFTKDPWTWGYTKEFAERFRMPEKWIEPEMKGILAIAFRVSNVGQPVTCGLNGREESCWPQLVCQFDIYYDNRIKLPWIKEAVTRDNLLEGVSSRVFTYKSSTVEKRYNSEKGVEGSNFSQRAADNRAIPVLMPIGFSDESGKERHYPVRFLYYDQEFSFNVGLIGLELLGACPDYPASQKSYWIDFFITQAAQEQSVGLARNKLKSIGLVHEALVPESFMKRVNAAREAGQQANEQVMKRLMYELQQRKLGQ